MKRNLVSGVLAVLVGCPALASADPIILFVSRGVNATASANFSTSTVDASSNQDILTARAAQANDNGWAMGFATMDSTVTPTRLVGSGGTQTSVSTTDAGWASGSAYYSVVFQFDRTYDLSLNADFGGAGTYLNGLYPSTQTLWTIDMHSGGTGTYSLFRYSGSGADTVDYTTRLAAGTWVFHMSSESDVASHVATRDLSGWSSFGFNLHLSPAPEPPAPAPTPEPASMLLLGTGLPGAFAARRRR